MGRHLQQDVSVKLGTNLREVSCVSEGLRDCLNRWCGHRITIHGEHVCLIELLGQQMPVRDLDGLG